ncbi:TonB-dependent receptor [Elongatibacter sediminis]|uniref:TonB-dependent receptor n=1 Tax=Elongatibacter sediminis TaxID=3119006 RepID=A0AAW9R4W3_9GAMM
MLQRAIALGLMAAVMTPAVEAADGALEEVIVTAQKREQNLQDISLSVSVLSETQLRNLRVETPADIANFTPGLFATTGNSGDPIFAIRGIGMNNGESNQNPAVTPYIDEVALPSNAMLGFQLFDLERVEVLKGPQGTLYGRNVTGGAINFITRKASQEFDAYARMNYGRYDLVEIEGAVGGAVTDNLALRVAGKSTTRDGWQTLILGPDVGEGVDSDNGAIDRQALRASALWTPSDNFELLFVADVSNNDSEVLGYEHAGNVLQDGSGLCSYPATGIRNETECASFAIWRSSVGGDPVTGERELISDPDTGPREVFASFSFGNRDRVDSYGFNNTMTWDLGSVLLTSVTGYREFEREVGGDNGSPFIVSDTFRAQDIDLFTQELRLASNTGDSPLSWVLGAYYSEDEIFDDVLFNFRDHASFSGLFDSTFLQETRDIALFGQAEYQLDERWTLIGGLRYTDEEREFTYGGHVTGTGAPVPIPFFNDKVSVNETTGKVGVDFRPNDDLLLYASVSRGFKGPGFPATIAFSIPQLAPFESEKLTSYEFGLKSTLANNSLVFNAAAYYYDWEDMQATTAVTREGIRLIVLANAGDARVYGVEAEASWFPTEEFSVRAGMNLMDAEITSGEFDGDTPVQTPKFSSSLIASYQAANPVGSVLPFVEVDYSYRSKVELALANNPAEFQDGYGLLGLRAGVKSTDERWEFSAWVRNLTDELYKASSFGAGSTFLPGRIVYAEPRTYGVSLGFTF